MIWFAGIWRILKSRNDKMFKNKDISLDKMIDEVKSPFWDWFKYKSNSMEYDIVQLHSSPKACLGFVD